MSLKEKIKQNPELKRRLLNAMVHPVKTRPRGWLRLFRRFYTERGKGSVVCRSARLDIVPFNPFSLEDLLRAHAQMMSALVETAGQFRRNGVGVFDGDRAVHIAPPFERVPELMANLFDWLKNADDHLLIRTCVFHYEFEFIHPFADGNGRMGRLWQSLILSKLNPVFQYLPVETLVHDNQLKYYEAINASTANNDSGAFIDFMLGELLNALKIHQGEPIGRVNGGVSGRVNEVFGYIKTHEGCNAGELSAALSIPKRTLARDLKKLADQVEFRGAPKTGGYYLK